MEPLKYYWKIIIKLELVLKNQEGFFAKLIEESDWRHYNSISPHINSICFFVTSLLILFMTSPSLSLL